MNYNGHLTFNEPWYGYVSKTIPFFGTRDIIAPFWTDLNNAAGGDIYYDQYINGQLLHQVTRDINEYFPGLDFVAKWVFIATWDKVFYFSHPAPVSKFDSTPELFCLVR